jgi:hypothetical protein
VINRELVIACSCLVATIAIAWLLDHPNKVTGTVILLIAFGVFVAVALLRNQRKSPNPRRMIRKDKAGEDGK